MKKLIKNILYIITPFAILVMVVNYYVDPANVFSNGMYESKVAAVLLKGHNVDDIQNCDERKIVEKIVMQMPATPDVAIVGSSRALEVSSDFFPNKKFMNYGVSHANINDILAIVGLMDSLQKLPKEIYIETSPVFSEISPTEEWASLYNYHQYAIKKMNIDCKVDYNNSALFRLIDNASKLFSFKYFQKSIGSLREIGSKKVQDIDTLAPKNMGRFSDFSITYPKSYTTPDTLKAQVDAVTYTTKIAAPKIDENRLKILGEIVEYLKQKNVKVYLVNTPFQPDCYKISEDKYHSFTKMETRIRQFAKTQQLKVFGTFSPFETNINRSQFYDQIHCSKKALRDVMKIVHE